MQGDDDFIDLGNGIGQISVDFDTESVKHLVSLAKVAVIDDLDECSRSLFDPNSINDVETLAQVIGHCVINHLVVSAIETQLAQMENPDK